ncbi:transposase, partial [Klebsiella pneumoniae]|uniref:transposase n=1 Tax=Klebsiella pneumoniae TaxID=573 RepID=UPI00163DDF4F
APDYSTIARFRSGRLDGVTEDLFRQLVEKLHERGDVRFDTLFVDGTKIESCANKYTFVWKKTTEKNEAKLQANVKKQWAQMFGEETVPEEIPATTMRNVLQML